jgi:sodium transport system permease protein
MLRSAGAVFRKELRDAVRDRRSLVSGLLYAFWGPLVMALALVAVGRDRDFERRLTVALEGRDRAPSLAAFLEERGVALVEPPAALLTSVRERNLPVAIALDADYETRFAQARPARVYLLYEGSSSVSGRDAKRVRELLEEYGRSVGAARLVFRGVAPDIASPLEIVERDLSTALGRAATALATLPLFLLLAAFIGGMNLACDTTAGERERGSLESLLHSPVPRLSLAMGKWGAAFVLSASCVALTILCSSLLLQHPRVQQIDLSIGLRAVDSAAVLVTLLPVAMLAPAIQLWMALYAGSFKEAQTQLSLLLFAPMLPGFLLAFGSIHETGWIRLVPVVGQHILVRDILRGVPLQLGPCMALAAFTLVAAALAGAATARLLGHERILGVSPA